MSAEPSSRRRATPKITQAEVLKLVRKVNPPSEVVIPDKKRTAARVRVKKVDPIIDADDSASSLSSPKGD